MHNATSLLARTLAALNESRLSLPEIAAGAGVGYEWLKKLKAGAISDPSVVRIEKLCRFLGVEAIP
jgi:transcriptional regulator with XRE-family HTH domain